jgi:hypothetical protein
MVNPPSADPKNESKQDPIRDRRGKLFPDDRWKAKDDL